MGPCVEVQNIDVEMMSTSKLMLARRPGSNLWRGIVNNWENLMPNMLWQMGNGRIRFHMWKIECGILPTNDLRWRHMAMDNICPLCLDQAETMGHAMRDCKDFFFFSHIYNNFFLTKTYNS